MLKLTVPKEDYAELDDAIKSLYTEDGDNFKLAVDGIEDTGALRRAKEREALAAREHKERADALEAELAEIRARAEDKDKDALRKSKDIDALEKSWKETADRRVADVTKQLDAVKQQMQRLLVDNVASQLAGELFTVPEIGKDFIAKRLRAEFDGEHPMTRVLDREGNPSALSIDEFKRELLDTPTLKGILIASKASGGGAGNGGNGGGAPTKKLSEMNDAERVEFYKNDPEGFRKASEAARNSRG